MAFAYWIGCAPQGLFLSLNGGVATTLFCFTFLYLAFSGPGLLTLEHFVR
jgi:putative oxidoreductase